ncbi:hypothetical protein ACP70R_021704 [Stipagrostis hirtigluma subsp. patula]
MESQERSPKQADQQLQSHGKKRKKERLLDFLRATPNSKELWLRRFRAPHALRRRVATLRARSATHVSASARYFLRAPAFARAVDWRALRGRCAAWARRPANAALLVWLAFVAAGVAFVFLLMTGALNSAVPDAARRRRWTEVANQVLNALFTVMCVYQHPQLCHHLVLLLRWRAADAAELRAAYCKNAGVNVFTFALLCAAPVLVFAVAALNVHGATLGYLVGAAGALLSVLGLMYGGFWRAQMRRRFGLPADRSMRVCGGRPAVADYAKWLLCAPCALAQEVRTANLYDVEEANLYVREGVDDVSPEDKPAMPPLEREGCVAPLTTGAGGAERVVAVETSPVPVRVQEVNT